MTPASRLPPGEHLVVHFLEPLGLTAAELALRCRISLSHVSEILAGSRDIDAGTAKRLARFFRMDPADWMALQAAWDLEQVSTDPQIVHLDAPGFLIGPAGATPLPPARRPRSTSLRVPATAGPSVSPEPDATRCHGEVRYPDGTRALISTPR